MAFNRSFDIRIWIPINIFGFLCVLFVAVAMISLSIQMHQHSVGKSLTKLHKSLSFCALFSFLISILADNFYIVFVKYPNESGHVSLFAANGYTICNFFWALGYGATYGLFWNRMQQCFESSSFRISRRSTVLFYIITSLYMLCMWTISVCWIPVTTGQWTWASFTLYYDILLWTRLIADFFINGLIVYLFSSKLYRLILFSTVARSRPHSSIHSQSIASRSYTGSPGPGSLSSDSPVSPVSTESTPKLQISSPSGTMEVHNPEQV